MRPWHCTGTVTPPNSPAGGHPFGCGGCYHTTFPGGSGWEGLWAQTQRVHKPTSDCLRKSWLLVLCTRTTRVLIFPAQPKGAQGCGAPMTLHGDSNTTKLTRRWPPIWMWWVLPHNLPNLRAERKTTSPRTTICVATRGSRRNGSDEGEELRQEATGS